MKQSRNERCWCKSGSKYKDCHYESDRLIEKYKSEGYEVPLPQTIKNKKQIEGIRRSAAITSAIFDVLDQITLEGVSTGEINEVVHDYTVKNGAIPASLHYKGYPKSVCISVNHVVCHGIPGVYKLKEGDIVNIDLSTIFEGYYSDASRMYTIGKLSETAEKLVRVSKECLYLGVEAVKPFQTLDVVGHAIEPHAQANGFSVVRDYGGHGIGCEFHEEPWVAHYVTGTKGMILLPGMVFTVEPMINEGRYETKTLKDDWTAVTRDAKLSSQWEHTVLVTDEGYEILC